MEGKRVATDQVCGVPFRDVKMFRRDRGGGCTIYSLVNTQEPSELYPLNEGVVWYMDYFISMRLLLKRERKMAAEVLC